MEIRNIAIIAHVDHGKTTLTNSLMHQTGMADENINMDSDALELERGITIYSKNTSVFYPSMNSGQVPTKINIVDTPGHADFSSEVERILRSIDCVLLLVDAQEGPMPQTKFVLKKSLELGLKPIVVINKIDKSASRIEEVHEMVYELFLDLGANDEQLNFKTVYASSRNGVAKLHPNDKSDNLNPLLDTILENVPPASNLEMEAQPLTAQPFNLAYDNFLGRCAISRIYSGKIKYNQEVVIKNADKEPRKFKVVKLFTFNGLNRQEVKEAVAGDIIMIAGLSDIEIGETIVENVSQELLPAIKIDEPTISLHFLVNNSPFAGKEGKFVTSRQIRERLEKELEVNVGLKIDFSNTHYYKVFGRGELHIAILLENLRREGYELQVSKPQAIIKDENGRKTEPFEEILIDVPENLSGVVIEKLSKRKGQLTEIKTKNCQTRMRFKIPTRGILGYRNEFVVDTKGKGILCAHFLGFDDYVGDIIEKETGSMISMITGKAAGFALWNLQERGTIYIGHGANVYEGMIIGNTPTGYDMEVNPIKGKELTNMRASGSDEAICLTPPWEITLERGLSVMNDDEYMEVTPKSIRLRKKHLTLNERKKSRKEK